MNGIWEYDIYNASQFDKGTGAVDFDIDLLDVNHSTIVSHLLPGRLMRGHCTYNGPEHQSGGRQPIPSLTFGAVVYARVNWRYHSGYEGKWPLPSFSNIMSTQS